MNGTEKSAATDMKIRRGFCREEIDRSRIRLCAHEKTPFGAIIAHLQGASPNAIEGTARDKGN